LLSADDDSANSAHQVVMGMPPVQKAALAMLPKLAPTHLPQVCRNCGSCMHACMHNQCQQPHLSCPGMPPCRHPVQFVCGWCAPALPQLYPDYIYSIMRLLRPEHVIEQWQEQQREAAERAAAAAAAQQQFTIPAEPAATGAAGSPPPPAGELQAEAAAARLANGGGGALAASGTVKQPPGQGAQAKFALTSAFVEKVRAVPTSA
jgi:hypothetical protein